MQTKLGTLRAVAAPTLGDGWWGARPTLPEGSEPAAAGGGSPPHVRLVSLLPHPTPARQQAWARSGTYLMCLALL